MLDKEKHFIIHCIKKYTNHSLLDLSEGIISKYTLSKMYHGLLCKEKTYHQLLARLNLYYSEDIDIIKIDILFQHIYNCINNNDQKQILLQILKIEQIIQKHPSHIYFIELNFYLDLLKKHYIEKEEIIIPLTKLNTLPYLHIDIYKCILYVLCENAYYCANFKVLEEIILTFIQNIEDPVFSFFKSILLASNYEMNKVLFQYRNIKHLFIEENKHFQIFRFKLLIAQSYILKHPKKAKEYLDKIKILSEQIEITNEEISLLHYAYGIIHIYEKKYNDTFDCFTLAYHNTSLTKNVFIPYLYILSILLKRKTALYMYTNKQLLNKESEHLYRLYKQNKKSEMLLYSIHAFPQKICENPYYKALLPILKTILIDICEESRQYKKIIAFDYEINKYRKNYY